MKKNYPLLITFLVVSMQCFAQNDGAETKYGHRFWMNPTEIVWGKYTVTYAKRIHKSYWLEAGVGYRYLPYSIVKNLPVAPHKIFMGVIYPYPKMGVGFTGPVATLSFSRDLKILDRGMRKKAKTNPEIKKLISTMRPLNNLRFQLQYQYIHHRPDCYYTGETESSMATYSVTMQSVSGQLLYSQTLGHTGTHFLWELYFGIGLHFFKGEEKEYTYDAAAHPDYDFCVDLTDPNIKTVTHRIDDHLLMPLQFGLRMGIQ